MKKIRIRGKNLTLSIYNHNRHPYSAKFRISNHSPRPPEILKIDVNYFRMTVEITYKKDLVDSDSDDKPVRILTNSYNSRDIVFSNSSKSINTSIYRNLYFFFK